MDIVIILFWVPLFFLNFQQIFTEKTLDDYLKELESVKNAIAQLNTNIRDKTAALFSLKGDEVRLNQKLKTFSFTDVDTEQAKFTKELEEIQVQIDNIDSFLISEENDAKAKEESLTKNASTLKNNMDKITSRLNAEHGISSGSSYLKIFRSGLLANAQDKINEYESQIKVQNETVQSNLGEKKKKEDEIELAKKKLDKLNCSLTKIKERIKGLIENSGAIIPSDGMITPEVKKLAKAFLMTKAFGDRDDPLLFFSMASKMNSLEEQEEECNKGIKETNDKMILAQRGIKDIEKMLKDLENELKNIKMLKDKLSKDLESLSLIESRLSINEAGINLIQQQLLKIRKDRQDRLDTLHNEKLIRETNLNEVHNFQLTKIDLDGVKSERDAMERDIENMNTEMSELVEKQKNLDAMISKLQVDVPPNNEPLPNNYDVDDEKSDPIPSVDEEDSVDKNLKNDLISENKDDKPPISNVSSLPPKQKRKYTQTLHSKKILTVGKKHKRESSMLKSKLPSISLNKNALPQQPQQTYNPKQNALRIPEMLTIFAIVVVFILIFVLLIVKYLLFNDQKLINESVAILI